MFVLRYVILYGFIDKRVSRRKLLYRHSFDDSQVTVKISIDSASLCDLFRNRKHDVTRSSLSSVGLLTEYCGVEGRCYHSRSRRDCEMAMWLKPTLIGTTPFVTKVSINNS
jgi:hypothetical protein